MKVVRKHDRDKPRGWFSLFFRLGGWVSLIIALVMMVVAGLMVGYARSAMLFERDGVTTQARILERRREVEWNDGEATRTYFVRFFFDTPTMHTVNVERAVPMHVYDETVVGEPRDIRYLPYEPERFEHTVGLNATNGRIARMVGWAVGAIGLGTLWFFGMKTNRAILARRYGEELVAEVTEMRRLKIEVNGRQQARLHWRLPDGTDGRSLMRDASQLVVYNPGDLITVFRRGRDMWWDGDVGPRAEETWTALEDR
ncbi:MAG: DUF3592 domain-containing protein [Pseudomonadota bacterium]